MLHNLVSTCKLICLNTILLVQGILKINNVSFLAYVRLLQGGLSSDLSRLYFPSYSVSLPLGSLSRSPVLSIKERDYQKL